jgi:hypothetical protein
MGCVPSPLIDVDYVASVIDDLIWSVGRMFRNRRKREYWERTCPGVTPSTTNRTCTDLGSIPGLRDESPATNPLNIPRTYIVVSN